MLVRANITYCGSKHIYHVNGLSLYYKSMSFVHKNFCKFVEYMQSFTFTLYPTDFVFEVLSPSGWPFVL